MANYCDILCENNEVIDMGTITYKIILPTKKDCSKTCDHIIKGCNDLNNCNKCKYNKSYCIPFAAGQTFDIQTRFVDEYNSDPINPTKGWGDFVKINLCNAGGSTVSTDHTQFTDDYVVGFDGMNSYQTVRINFDSARALAGDCFSFQITVHSVVGAIIGEPFCSEPFSFQDNTCDDKLLCFEGKYEDIEDCCGNYYGVTETDTGWIGTSNFTYSNKICIRASIEKSDSTVEITEFGTKRSRVTRTFPFNISTLEPIPCYINDYIANIFDAPVSCVGDVEYSNDGFQVENLLSKGEYYMWQFEVYEVCDKSFLCG